MGSAPRILHVVTDTDRRGAQVFAEEITGRSRQDGAKIRSVALAPGKGGGGLPFEVLGPRRLAPTSLRNLRRALRKVDVAVGFGSSTLLAGTLAGIGLDTVFVYRSIGESGYWANTLARRARVRAMLRRADGVIALWNGAASDLVDRYGLKRERVFVIPRGVDSAKFPVADEAQRASARAELGLPRFGSVACAVGSLSSEKNLGLAIDAVALHPGMRLAIAGSGPDRALLEAHAEAVAPGRVRFLGALDSVVSVYQAADVNLLTSRSEGMPGVLIEAGLCGTPSVATAVGAVPEMIEEGRSGFVVPRDATPHDIAARLRAAVDGSSLLGTAMRKHCLDHYELGVVADRWLTMLRTVAN